VARSTARRCPPPAGQPCPAGLPWVSKRRRFSSLGWGKGKCRWLSRCGWRRSQTQVALTARGRSREMLVPVGGGGGGHAKACYGGHCNSLDHNRTGLLGVAIFRMARESVGKSSVGRWRGSETRFVPRNGCYPHFEPICGYLGRPTHAKNRSVKTAVATHVALVVPPPLVPAWAGRPPRALVYPVLVYREGASSCTIVRTVDT